MSAVGEENSPLVTKCMDLCLALANQGEAFNSSLSIGSSFSFSLDTRSKEIMKNIRTKKPSPSTIRRNAKRRQDFLNKKQDPSAVSQIAEVAAVPVAPLCDLCDYKAASEKGLKAHTTMKHKKKCDVPINHLVKHVSTVASASSMTTTTSHTDAIRSKTSKPRHLCWFDNCKKLPAFQSLHELNSHIQNMHEMK